MKYLVLIVIASVAGMIGGALTGENGGLGAIAARTTITAPWTFNATTTFAGNVSVTTSDTATSTVIAGCIQTYATSTATPHRWTISNVASATTTFQGSNSRYYVVDQFGSCPRI